MIEPLRPEIESAQTVDSPGRAKEKPPQNGDGARINFPVRPVNRTLPESGTTRPPGGKTTPKDASPTRTGTETARIPIFTDFAKIPTVLPAPSLKGKHAGNQDVMDTIPKPLCWVLLGSSIAILLIEIWNYIS